MKRQSKLTEKEQQQERTVAQARQSGAVEFAGVEEMLRHDALHTPVPPRIAERLADSIRQEPSRPQPWWRRWFGGTAS